MNDNGATWKVRIRQQYVAPDNSTANIPVRHNQYCIRTGLDRFHKKQYFEMAGIQDYVGVKRRGLQRYITCAEKIWQEFGTTTSSHR